jgi:microcystin-dependent protein
MSEPFVGEIRMFAGNFAPRGWAFCDGQLLAVSQNDALFSLLGTIYGGDGRTTFGLPDLRGRIPIHTGQGPGLSNRRLGASSGQETVTLAANQLPSHSHPLQASTQPGTESAPAGAVLAQSSSDIYVENPPAASIKNLSAGAVSALGGSQAHTNLMPFLAIHFIISLFGIFPSRN